MYKNISKSYSALLIIFMILLCCGKTFSQQDSNSVEKIYTHTDRPFYFPGETIWFKSYAVSEDNKPSTISEVLIAELISPKGDVIATKQYYLELGYCYGDFTIKENWVGGVYTIRTYTNYMRNFGLDLFFTKDIVVQKVVIPELLVKMDLEKESYGKGSHVVADFSLEDLDNSAISEAKVNAELYIGGKSFAKNQFLTNELGEVSIEFDLPENLQTMDVVLVATVSHQGKTESISRTVPVLLDNIDLQFLPEGGKIIDGVTNVVAFKAVNEWGKPADVEGVILDDLGNEVLSFTSFHDGMGTIKLDPEMGRSYFANIKNPFESDSLYALPEIYSEGAKLGLVNQDEGVLNFEIFSSFKLNGRINLLSANNDILSSQPVLIDSGSLKSSIPIVKFPRGIAKLQLIDKDQNIISERLVFLNFHKGLKILIQTDKDSYLPREKVKLDLKTSDYDGNPLSSNLSLAVVDNSLLTLADDKQDQIESYLLMSSELSGTIHEPSYYFNQENEDRFTALDHVLLTHGWRDYIQNSDKEEGQLKFKPERRDIVFGRVEDEHGNPITANILVFDRQSDDALSFKTDTLGEFQFKMEGMSDYVVAAYREDRKKLKIFLEKTINQKYGSGNMDFSRGRNIDPEYENFEQEPTAPLDKPIQEEARITTSLSADSANLDEVVIVGYGAYEKASSVANVQIIEKNELLGASGNIAQVLQGRVTGIEITNGSGSPGASQVTIRGSSSVRGANDPLFIIDGIPQNINGSGSTGMDFSKINASEIESVTVLKGTSATAMYGVRGANGVVLITTESGNYGNNKILFSQKYKNYAIEQVSNNRTTNLNVPARFYVPKYDKAQVGGKRIDFRKTLYWNPVIQTDEKGEASIEFHNSDALNSFKAIAEGISYSGNVGHGNTVYSIAKPLSISAKFPNYSSLNDTLNIPVRISNNSDENLIAKIDIQASKNFSILNKKSFTDSIRIESRSFRIVDFIIVPKQISNQSQIQASVRSKTFADSFSQEVEVISPYFPIETSISGVNGGTYSFEISDLITESTSAYFNVYVDVVGEVMNGIEGILQEPYGCFEQTSSATYPNVMVLQYLRETGKSNVDIEKKALGYIKEGYNKLISFETKEGGFEWFGKTPPHETLTAFGILEFTDMQKVYPDVSIKMIDRTIDWLLQQRDGKGGFNKSNKGYDSFASSPPLVANAYIVYVLSEVGMANQIEKEYQEALSEALRSKDSYRMALLALAADKKKDNENFRKLISLLIEQWKENGFSWNTEATITRSYGKSQDLETTAIAVLAAMRSGKNSEFIAKSIEYIVSKRERGTFGSTQSTVMCLKALLEYNKSQKQKFLSEENAIQLIINGNSLNLDETDIENGILHIPNLGDYFNSGNQEVSVKFSNSKNTFPYSLNIEWQSSKPKSSEKTPLILTTEIMNSEVKLGGIVRMEVEVTNNSQDGLGMATAIIGIPSGASVQPYQLKELVESGKIAFYEVFNNYLVLYWRSFNPEESKALGLDLKLEIPGTFVAPSSTVYPYYGNEFKYWIKGEGLRIVN